MSFNPPLDAAEKEKLLEAVKNGDEGAVTEILNSHGTTGQDNSTLLGLTKLQSVANGEKVSPAEMKKLFQTLADGDPALTGGAGKELLKYAMLSKINGIFEFAKTVVDSLAGIGIPNNIVPIVTIPDLPFGTVFPLGNGVFGLGTGGQGSVGLYQGYIPSPPEYSDSSDALGTIDISEQTFFSVINNRTSKEIKYDITGKSSEQSTLSAGGWVGWALVSPPSSIKYRANGKNSWTSSKFSDGAFEWTDSSGRIVLNPVKTNLTFKSPGNPIPFKFYANGDKFVIEPGKPLTLKMPDNECIKIKFARSKELNDIAEYIVGGEMEFEVGVDKSTGKFAVFPAGSRKEEKPLPKQDTSVKAVSVVIDAPKITAANIRGLPVRPDYD